MSSKTNSTAGFKAMGVFSFFGAAMAGLAGITLTWRGTVLDRIWVLNRRAFQQLAPLGSAIGIAFLLLSLTLAVAGRGWFSRRRWGWRLAVGIVATQFAGDFVNAIRGEWLEGLTGFVLAGSLLFYLFHPRIRAAFASGSHAVKD